MTDFAEYKRLPADERDRLGFAKWQEEQRNKSAMEELARRKSDKHGRDQPRTGWPHGLLQDDSRELSQWFASKPDARLKVREACADIQPAGQSMGEHRRTTP